MILRRTDIRRRWTPGRERSAGRWIVVAVGVAVLATALAFAAGPYRQTREFRHVVDCDRGPADCFASESGWIRGRRTYTTTTTDTDANGVSHTTTTTHYEVTWERTDGTRTARDVSASFYGLAKEGQPANLRIWRGQVVGVEVMGGSEWFLPASGQTLSVWLYVAWFGFGVLLWGLLFGWWDGFFMFFFRTFSWMFISITPVNITSHALAYGWQLDTGHVVEMVLAIFFAGIASAMLIGSLKRW